MMFVRFLLIGSAALAMAVGCGKSDKKGEGKSGDTAQSGDTKKTGDVPPDTTKDDGTAAAKTADNTGGADHELPGDPVAGEAVYKKTCLACHGADGRGNGGITGADFIGDKSRLAKSNEVLFTSISEGVTTGKVPMPPQKTILSEKEINDSLAYVRKQFGAK